MPSIVVSSLFNSNREVLFKTIKDVEKYPEFMRDVKSVKLVKKTPSGFVSAWEIDVDGTPIDWLEENTLDNERYLFTFKAIEGSYKYEGRWKLEEVTDNRTRVIIEAAFDWGVPHFEKYFGHVYEKKARLALLGMLYALKRRIHG